MTTATSLTRRQQKVLDNVLAWSDVKTPSSDAVQEFFDWSDKGIPPRSAQAIELMWGWRAHYGDEFSWIQSYENGGNPPALPPQAWIYSICWAYESSWGILLADCLREWNPKVFARAYTLAAFIRGHMSKGDLQSSLAAQKA